LGIVSFEKLLIFVATAPKFVIAKEPEKSAFGFWPSPKADFSGSLGIKALCENIHIE